MGFLRDIGKQLSRSVLRDTDQPTCIRAAIALAARTMPPEQLQRDRAALLAVQLAIDLAALTHGPDPRVRKARSYIAELLEAIK